MMPLRQFMPLLGIVIGAGLAACDQPSAPFPYPERELIEGTVTAIDLEHEPHPRIMIEERPTYWTDEWGPDATPFTHGQKYWFMIWESTVLERELSSGVIVRIGIRDLEVGSRARGWTGIDVFDSFPAQTAASRVRVLLGPQQTAH